MSPKEEIGTLVVVVLKAKNLNNKGFWKQDVFGQISLNGDKKQTHVDVKGGQNPEWDEEIRMPIYKDTQEIHRTMEVSVWVKEPRKEESIGAGLVPLEKTLKTGEFDDWVPLELNGVLRGEVYLEMTFYAHAPPPAGHSGGLAVPKANLQRRPSKLSPSERLSRPSRSGSELLPLVNQQPPPATPKPQSPSPPSTRLPSPSPPRHGRESPLPPVPGGPEPHANLPIPSALLSGHPHPQPQGNSLGLTPGGPSGSAPGLTPHVPSVLRPRNPKSSPTPIPGPRVEYNGVVPAPEPDYRSESPPRGYTPVVPPSDTPFGWGADDHANGAPSTFSFPVPNVGGAAQSTHQNAPYPPASYTPSPPSGTPNPAPYPPQNQQPPPQPSFAAQPTYQQPPPQTYQSPPPQATYQQQPSYPPTPYHPTTYQSPPPPSFTPAPPGAFPPPANDNAAGNGNGQDLPDPYLLKRYQSPLPLPPGAENESHHRQRATSHSHAAPVSVPAPRKQTPPPPTRHSPPPKHPQQQTQQQSKPTPASQVNPDNARIQALKQVEEEAARRRAQEKRDRELAMKQAAVEDERKAQEERDLELARQLDRELNLGVGS